MPLKDASRSTGHVQKPGSMVQIWRRSTDMHSSVTESLKSERASVSVRAKLPAAVMSGRPWLLVSVRLVPILQLKQRRHQFISTPEKKKRFHMTLLRRACDVYLSA